jgi:hypothetical protein
MEDDSAGTCKVGSMDISIVVLAGVLPGEVDPPHRRLHAGRKLKDVRQNRLAGAINPVMYTTISVADA